MSRRPTPAPPTNSHRAIRAPIGDGAAAAGAASRPAIAAAALAVVLGLLAACATNPATGERQLALIGERDEIALGRQAAGEVDAGLGLYPDEAVQRFVADLGRKLAAESERPGLPWSFKVVDDPAVNAFALPGGFIYVTRGILTHLSDEAELASVVGHEIGHVTARHGVEQMSRAQLAGLGLGIGAIFSPAVRDYGDLAQAGVGLLFLKYGRADERQADELGLRYMVRGGYDPRRMPEVFRLLDRVGQAAGGGRVPNWLSTHPAPEDRFARMSAEVGRLGGDFSTAEVGRGRYLAAIDGMVFGEDPREGYFDGSTFYHPAFAFRIRFPQGWQAVNQRQAVAATSSGNDARVVLTLAAGDSPAAAATAFFSQEGVERGGSWRPAIRNLPIAASYFTVPREQGEDLVGAAAFVQLGDRVLQLVGYGTRNGWTNHDREIQGSIESFGKVTDPKILGVQPKRVKIVDLPRATTLEDFAKGYPSTVDLPTLALINQLDGPSARLAAGAKAKRVVGGAPP